MWGYYADNKGICIEYDTKNMIFDIVTSLVSEMSENLTSLLLEKEYDKTNRDISDKPNRTKFANKIFFDESEVCSSIKKNKKLMELSTEEQLNFVKNIYIKRLWGRKVEYRNSEELTKIESSLFENKNDLKVKGKYFTKNDFWQHEKEYRFILSLGGRKIIKLREGTIRSITFGYNTEMKTINYIKNIINNNQLGKGIEYKKIEIENNNLIAKEVINNTN